MADLEPLGPREALDFFRSKGLAPELNRFDWRDHWRQEHARAFVVAKAMRDDVLKTIRAEVDRAIAEGRTLDQFRKALQPKLEAFGWWGRQLETDPLTGETREVQLGSQSRLRTIFDTNMRTSLAAGRWARIQRTKGAFPYLEYRQIQRETRREEHERYHGLIRPVDDPIWQEIFPPNGWFCGCSVRQLNDRMLRREGKELSPAPELDRDAWQNRRTGEIERPPRGVHPGFDTNPGATFLDIRAAHRAITEHLDEAVRGVDLAITEEIRARGVRDRDESLAFVDLATGDVLAWNRSVEGKPNQVAVPAPMLNAIRDGSRRLVAIHSHPSSGSFSPADLSLLAQSPGLEEVVAVGFDGSQYRMRLAGQLTPAQIQRTYRRAHAAILDALDAGRLTTEDANALFAHVAVGSLSRRGRLLYDVSASGRLTTVFERNAEVVEELIGQLATGRL